MDNRHKDSAELEKQAREQRNQAIRTAHEIDEDLSPGQLIDQYYFRGEQPSFRAFMTRVQEDPVPGALVGAAMAWTVSADTARSHGISPHRVAEDLKHKVSDQAHRIADTVSHKTDDASAVASDSKSAIKDSLGDMKAKGQSLVEQARDGIHSAVDQAKDGMHSAQESVSSGADWVQHKGQSSFASEPLLNVALGFSLGAALGAMTPISDRERELLQPAANKLREQGEELKDQAMELKDQATSEVKSKASEVKDVAVEAVKEIRDDLLSH